MSKADYSKKTFCPAPWMSVEIGESGQLRPCCVYYGSFGNIRDTSLAEAFNGIRNSQLREVLRRDEWPKECWHCSNGEYMGSTSRRTEYIEYLHKYKIEFNYQPGLVAFVVRFSNLCNLACRHCKSGNSTKWVKYENLLAEKGFDVEAASPFSITDKGMKEMEDFLLSHRSTLRSITVKGGEPIIEPQFRRFLSFLVEQDMAKNIDLVFFTNGTRPSDEIMEYLKEFSFVGALVSVEGTGSVYQYIRNNSTTLEDDVLGTATAYSKLANTNVAWRPTFCAYNLWEIENLYNFCCVEFPFNTVNLDRYEHRVLGHFIQQRVDYPRYLTPGIFDAKAREEYFRFLDQTSVEEQGKEFIRKYFKLYPYNEDWRRQFVEFTQTLDKAQGKSLLDVEPRFKAVMQG
ncbi:MAG: twitch domain-containing radical SAM protein [Bdellovibrionales bacterium]|nr:twitch domain-containing radical SAM protein [Bdellovibrionales bacterium]